MSDSFSADFETGKSDCRVAAGFRQSAMALLVVDENGVVIEASEGAAQLFGCERSTLVATPLSDRIVDTPKLATVLQSDPCRRETTIQLEAIGVDGELIPIEIHWDCFGDERHRSGGEPVGDQHMLLLQDIRARQHADESRAARLAKLSLLNQVSEALYGAQLNLEQVLQAVLICMTAGQGLRFNRAFLLLVDAKSTSLRGEMAIGPSDAAEAARIWHDLANQPGDLFEMMTSYDQSIKQTDVAVNEIVRHMNIPLADEDNILIRTMLDGHANRFAAETEEPGIETLRQWLGSHEFAIAPMSTQRGPVGVIVADNAISGNGITALDLEFLQMFANQTAGAIENSRLYSELEQRLSDLHIAHKKQRQDQETLLKMERLSVMGETSAIVAHELRNPLVAIGGFARNLTRGLAAGDPHLVSATIIVEEVSRMERIIHDLLDFIRPPKLLRKATMVDEVVLRGAEKNRPRAEEAGVELVLDLGADGLVAEMHPGEIQQVMQNFIANAIQAIDGSGKIEVRSRGVEGGVKVTVIDSGPGFDPGLEEKLHAPFFSTKPTGSGLGLTICVQIIKAHGGVLEARNRPEGGAEFSFILPLKKQGS